MINELTRSNSAPVETWRLFIALPLPAGVREIIDDIEGQLKAHEWPVNWVDPDLAHIALKFLGDTPTDLMPPIERQLGIVAARQRDAEAGVGNVGAFPSTNRARVIWLGLDGDLSPLAALAQDVVSAMSGLGFPREERPFRPHITLGRLRHGKTPPADCSGSIEKLNIPRMSVSLDQMQLVCSVLGHAGPTYTTLCEWPLGLSSMNNVVPPVELVEHG